MKNFASLFILFGLLAACATPTAYGPAARAGGMGYFETRIESDRYRVTFNTAAGGADRAQDFALLRAAELTLASGADWFVVDQRYGGLTGGGSSLSIGGGVGSFGRHSGVSVGTGVGIPIGAGPSATATVEIHIGRGAKPPDPFAYDARDVQRSIRGRMTSG